MPSMRNCQRALTCRQRLVREQDCDVNTKHDVSIRLMHVRRQTGVPLRASTSQKSLVFRRAYVRLPWTVKKIIWRRIRTSKWLLRLVKRSGRDSDVSVLSAIDKGSMTVRWHSFKK